MNLGAIFPQTEIGSTAGQVRDYAQAVEGLGFDHIAIFDHVLGASASRYSSKDMGGHYREQHLFHEPFVLFGYLAGVTRSLGFATCVLVLPQRQTALVAKQAAELDILCGGRLRLGVGIGWNWVEYEALGVPFSERAARQVEQIELLRQLWTQPLVDFEGSYHRVSSAGLNPLPIQRPIPIWLGGMAEPVLQRIGAIADGWFPQFPSMNPSMVKTLPRNYEDPAVLVERVRNYARLAGRDPEAIGIEGRIVYAKQNADAWRRDVAILRGLGISHLSVLTTNAGFTRADQHVAALQEVKRVIDEIP